MATPAYRRRNDGRTAGQCRYAFWGPDPIAWGQKMLPMLTGNAIEICLYLWYIIEYTPIAAVVWRVLASNYYYDIYYDSKVFKEYTFQCLLLLKSKPSRSQIFRYTAIPTAQIHHDCDCGCGEWHTYLF